MTTPRLFLGVFALALLLPLLLLACGGSLFHGVNVHRFQHGHEPWGGLL